MDDQERYEHKLREALQGRASTASTDALDEIAANVVHEGHQVERRRSQRVATGAVLATLLAGGVWATSHFTDDASQSPDTRANPVTATPSRSASTTPTASTPTPMRPATTATAVAQLPVGQPVAAVPRTELSGSSWTLVTSDGRVKLPAGSGLVTRVVEAGDATLAVAHSAEFLGGDVDPDARLLRIGPDGTVRTLTTGAIGGLVASPAGDRTASIVSSQQGTSLVIRGADGTIERSIALAGSLEGLDVTLAGWTSEGVIFDGTSPDPSSGIEPIRLALDPEAANPLQQAEPVKGVESVVPLGAGQVLSLTSTGGKHCFATGATLADATRVGCSTSMLSVTTSATGAAFVRPIDDSGQTPAGSSVWLVDPDGTAHPALAPAIQLSGGALLWEGPGVSVHQVVDQSGRTSWVRWQVPAGIVEQAPEPSSGQVQG